jgi:carboxylesterase
MWLFSDKSDRSVVIESASPPLTQSIVSAQETPQIVLFHGLASTPKEFGLLASPLRRLGIGLHAPNLPGYSHGSLVAQARWQEWVDTATQVVEDIALRHGPVLLGGLCTGAVLALAVAASLQGSPSIAGLALLSPLLAYDGWGLPWWYSLRHIAYLARIEHRFSMQERPPYGLKNERLRTWVRQQMGTGEASLSGPASVSLQVVRESERLSAQAHRWLAGLHLPTLVLHAREDEICSLASVQTAVSRAPRDLLRMTVLENSYHMVSADNDREQVARELAAHGRACLAVAPPVRRLQWA